MYLMRVSVFWHLTAAALLVPVGNEPQCKKTRRLSEPGHMPENTRQHGNSIFLA